MPTLTGYRIAVIGGTGFIGSHLAARLIEYGADVLAVGRRVDHLVRLGPLRGHCRVGLADICNADSITPMLCRFRPDVVFHLASHPDGAESFQQVAKCLHVNGLGLVNTLEAAEAAHASLFVYGDSTKDYGNTPDPYSVSRSAAPVCSYAIVKSAGWQLCQLVSSFAALKTVALRPTFVYGPGQGRNVLAYVGECVASGRPVRLMGGDQTRDPLFIDDAVEAFIAAINSPDASGQAIPIGGGCEMSVRALCEAAIATLGGTVPVVTGAEAPRPTEIWRSRCDNTDATRLLGWMPRVSLAEGLMRVFQGDPAVMRPTRPAIMRPGDCYPQVVAPGLEFHMLDRRHQSDRRTTSRGGRRDGDRHLPMPNGTYVPLGPAVRTLRPVAGESL